MPMSPRLFGVAAAAAATGAAGAAAVARWWRRRHASTLEAWSLARRPLGPDGLIAGAGGFTLHRHHAPAVLLLHGAGDTPGTLRYLGDDLHGRGYSVHAPLLPGHGRTIREFAVVGADAWYDAARDELRALHARHEWVAVVGLSMGGALAARLAADAEFAGRLPALVLLAPYLSPPRFVRAAAWSSVGWGVMAAYVQTMDPRSIHDPAEREKALGYGVMTPAALRALVRTADTGFAGLPRVQAPTLMIQSRHDNRIPADGAERTFARLGAADKQMLWREVGGHVLTVDHGREDVIAAVADWLAAHGGAAASAAGQRGQVGAT